MPYRDRIEAPRRCIFSRRHAHVGKPSINLHRVESQQMATLHKGNATLGDETPDIADTNAESVSDLLNRKESGNIGAARSCSLLLVHPDGLLAGETHGLNSAPAAALMRRRGRRPERQADRLISR